MKWITIDLETSIKNRGEGAVGDFQASPFHPLNKIVCIGTAQGASSGVQVDFAYEPTAAKLLPEPILYVGQNIGFDLQYLWKEDIIQPTDPNVYIWDIGHVEYLLSGQTTLYPSLDTMAAKYGLPLKPDLIRQYWDDGVDTELIPEQELAEYQVHDVETTRAIFLKQWEQVYENEALLNLIRIKMDDILCTTLMEYNGMAFNKPATFFEVLDVNIALNKLELNMRDEAKRNLWPKEVKFDPAKNEHVSAYLWGGWLTYELLVQMTGKDGEPLFYKSGPKKGEPRMKKGEASVMYAGVLDRTSFPPKPTKKDGVFKVGDEELSPLSALSPLVETLLEWRALKKHLSTYVIGYSQLVWPDGRIHPSINHSSTRTGRQSCTKPNLQNVTSAED